MLVLAQQEKKLPCYVEKPMARNFTESEEMSEAFKRRGVPLFVAYYRRAYPRYIKLREILQARTVSSVRYVMQQKAPQQVSAGQIWRNDVSVSGGGLFMDVGSHALDLLDFLLGPLENVAGVASRADGEKGVETQVSMVFTVGSAVGSAVWDFAASSDAELLEFQTSEGSIFLENVMNGDSIVLQEAAGEQTLVFPAPVPVQGPLIQTVVDAIKANDVSLCPSTAETALRTAKVMDVVLDTYYKGRADAFWERPDSWQ